MSNKSLDEKCLVKEREWRDALLEKQDALQADRERLTQRCEALMTENEGTLETIKKVRDENYRITKQRDLLATELRRTRFMYHSLLAEKQKILRHIDRCESQLEKDNILHKKEREKFQDIANSLKKEVESLNEANSNNIKDIKNETEHKIAEIQEYNEIIQKQHKEEILRLNEKIKQLIEENKILLIEQNENQEEIKILRAKQISLNATMEKQAKSMENEQNLAKGRIFNLEQKVQDYCTENQLIKEENYNYCSKLFTLEQKLQTITSENLDLKRFQTDFGYQKEQMIKKIDKLYEEKQKIVAELECIKNHPIITELEQVKQQNDILRNVVLEQKHLIIKYNSEKELANQKIMVSSETQTINHISVQTEKKTKELKKHNCIQRNIIAVSNPKQNEAIALSEAEKRIQDLENIVFFLKHILVESATSNINAYCLDK